MARQAKFSTIEQERQVVNPYQHLKPLYAVPLSPQAIAQSMADFYDDYEYDYYPQDQVHNRMVILLVWTVAIALVSTGLMWWYTTSNSDQSGFNLTAVVAGNEQTSEQRYTASTGLISPVFSPEVQYWAPRIVEWAAAFDLDPNMAATVMQIESCGDPQAQSGAGAQGLFQVMPFHFSAGENMKDPDTNAKRGMNYLAERMVQTDGDTGLAFAGYNGGHGAAGSSWNYWAAETQRYYIWATGIYADATNGNTESETLQQWMQAGGSSLCNQAATRLGLR